MPGIFPETDVAHNGQETYELHPCQLRYVGYGNADNGTMERGDAVNCIPPLGFGTHQAETATDYMPGKYHARRVIMALAVSSQSGSTLQAVTVTMLVNIVTWLGEFTWAPDFMVMVLPPMISP